MKQLVNRNGHKVRFTFCAYGTKWQKATTLAVWGTSAFDSLARSDSRHDGICTFTGQPHKILMGYGEGGVPWTLIAEPYPRKLCFVWASLANML